MTRCVEAARRYAAARIRMEAWLKRAEKEKRLK